MKTLRKYLASDSKEAAPSHEQSFQQSHLTTVRMQAVLPLQETHPSTQELTASRNSTTKQGPASAVPKHLLSGDFYFCYQV